MLGARSCLARRAAQAPAPPGGRTRQGKCAAARAPAPAAGHPPGAATAEAAPELAIADALMHCGSRYQLYEHLFSLPGASNYRPTTGHKMSSSDLDFLLNSTPF